MKYLRQSDVAGVAVVTGVSTVVNIPAVDSVLLMWQSAMFLLSLAAFVHPVLQV
jgi:hypothetical protein